MVNQTVYLKYDFTVCVKFNSLEKGILFKALVKRNPSK